MKVSAVFVAERTFSESGIHIGRHDWRQGVELPIRRAEASLREREHCPPTGWANPLVMSYGVLRGFVGVAKFPFDPD
jgi:hypothetical protein